MIPLLNQAAISDFNDICKKIIKISGNENMDIELAMDIAALVENNNPGIIEYFLSYLTTSKSKNSSFRFKRYRGNGTLIYLVIAD